jgi:hypothetical protein
MLDVSVPAIARRSGAQSLFANRQSDSPEAILTGEDGIDAFEQREEQLVTVLHGLAGTDTDVKVVFGNKFNRQGPVLLLRPERRANCICCDALSTPAGCTGAG